MDLKFRVEWNHFIIRPTDTLGGCGLTAVRLHPPSSVHTKKPSAAQPRRRSWYGHLKAEDIH
jgi:hypothetical protein